jgi:hypothetical protein
MTVAASPARADPARRGTRAPWLTRERWTAIRRPLTTLVVGDRVAVFATRPGRLQEIIPIDLPRPRPPGVKQSPEFQSHVARIVALIGTYESRP